MKDRGEYLVSTQWYYVVTFASIFEALNIGLD